MLDTLEKIATPEGVELSLRPAGLYSRTLAWLIDFLIKAAVFFVLTLVWSSFGDYLWGVVLLFMFFLLWFYNVVFEVLGDGATPGKKALNLQVVYANGAPVSWSGSILRNFLRFVDFLPNLYALGAAVCLGNERFQRLGDMAANTVVTYRDGGIEHAPAASESGSAPLRVALSRDEQRAILQFAERAPLLSQERCVELADLLTPITGADGEAGVARLIAHANWLSGRR